MTLWVLDSEGGRAAGGFVADSLRLGVVFGLVPALPIQGYFLLLHQPPFFQPLTPSMSDMEHLSAPEAHQLKEL